MPNYHSRINKNSFNLFFAVYSILTIYFLQGVLYPSGSIISQGVLAIFLSIALFAFVRNFSTAYLPGFLKIWMLFCIIQVVTFIISPKKVYGTLYEAIGTVSTFDQMRDIICYCLSVFIGLNVGKKRLISYRSLAALGLVLLFLSMIRFAL